MMVVNTHGMNQKQIGLWYPNMDKRTVSSAHERIDELQIQVAEIKTEMKIQFKDLYNRIKRLEAIMIGISGASLLLLLRMTFMS